MMRDTACFSIKMCIRDRSTDKQVDHNDKNQADIPMQRKACHAFCEKMGWTIVHEEQEDGVSGHKVRAENRDKLQIIKERARHGKFDILLVFMFDRIGRIADETPFVVEWFVKNGVRVWSTQEGEQRFDSHTDKLTNYIRFWQADGESEKTSIRTKTALGQLVEGGGLDVYKRQVYIHWPCLPLPGQSWKLIGGPETRPPYELRDRCQFPSVNLCKHKGLY